MLQVSVPAGFPFQGSIPWWARWWISPHDPRCLEAYAAHDFGLHVLKLPRDEAVAPFGNSLRRNGVSSGKRLAMVLAVIVWRWR